MNFNFLQEREIPAILGLDNRENPWDLWHRCKGDCVLKPRKRTAREICHATLRDWIQENALQIFGSEARRPAHAVQIHENIPICAEPDLVIDQAPTYGKGFGVISLFIISAREWRGFWHPGNFSPKPPAYVHARLQASMLASGAHWSLALPMVDLNNPKAPLLIEPDLEMQKQIGKAALDFFQSVRENRPPAPDHKATPELMQLLAAQSSSRRELLKEGKPLSVDKRQELESILDKYEDLKNRESLMGEDRRNIQRAMKDTEAILLEAISQHGTLSLNGTRIFVRSEEREPAVMEQRTTVVLQRENPAEQAAQQTSAVTNQI